MILIVVLLPLVLGLVVFSYIKASRAAKQGMIPEELDLNSVRDALMEKQGWSRERAESARREYVRFLTLLKMKPEFMVVPWPDDQGRDDLDQFWHQHILDTAKYAADCERLFGRMIHHYPHVVRGSGEETDSVERTRRLYARTFEAESDGSGAETVWLMGGGDGGAGDSHGSGHGGHGHGGHGDGGHSCGGHSCGHSCGGHGCGGH